METQRRGSDGRRLFSSEFKTETSRWRSRGMQTVKLWGLAWAAAWLSGCSGAPGEWNRLPSGDSIRVLATFVNQTDPSELIMVFETHAPQTERDQFRREAGALWPAFRSEAEDRGRQLRVWSRSGLREASAFAVRDFALTRGIRFARVAIPQVIGTGSLTRQI